MWDIERATAPTDDARSLIAELDGIWRRRRHAPRQHLDERVLREAPVATRRARDFRLRSTTTAVCRRSRKPAQNTENTAAVRNIDIETEQTDTQTELSTTLMMCPRFNPTNPDGQPLRPRPSKAAAGCNYRPPGPASASPASRTATPCRSG